MATLTLLIASIAVADSINPSTVAPAIWLASTSPSHLVSFTIGVFVIYLAAGLVLVFGPGPALISALRHLGGTIEHAVEAFAGVAVLALALALWRSRGSQRIAGLSGRGCARASAFALGAGIMAVELPTAFMYFGAISAVIAAHTVAPIELSLVVVYNMLFVAPLVAIIVIRRRTGERTGRWLATGWERLLGFGQAVLACLTGSAGLVLLVVGITGLLAA